MTVGKIIAPIATAYNCNLFVADKRNPSKLFGERIVLVSGKGEAHHSYRTAALRPNKQFDLFAVTNSQGLMQQGITDLTDSFIDTWITKIYVDVGGKCEELIFEDPPAGGLKLEVSPQGSERRSSKLFEHKGEQISFNLDLQTGTFYTSATPGVIGFELFVRRGILPQLKHKE